MHRPATRTVLLSVALLGLATPVLAGGGSNYDTPAIRAAAGRVADAQSQINRAIIDLRREFESSPELHSARSSFHSAVAHYREACDEAIKPLRAAPEYRLAAEHVVQLERKLSWGRYDDRLSDQEMSDLAHALLDARQKVSSLEAQVLAIDTTVETARYALLDAHAKLVGLRREFNRSIPFDPQYLAAKRELEAARLNLHPSR